MGSFKLYNDIIQLNFATLNDLDLQSPGLRKITRLCQVISSLVKMLTLCAGFLKQLRKLLVSRFPNQSSIAQKISYVHVILSIMSKNRMTIKSVFSTFFK